MEFISIIKKIGVWILFFVIVCLFALVGEIIAIMAFLSIPAILGALLFAIHVTFDDLT